MYKSSQVELYCHSATCVDMSCLAIWFSACRRSCESGSTSCFPGNGCNLSCSAHESNFIRSNENAIETFLKTVDFLHRYIHIKHPCQVLISKRVVLMFIQRSQTPQINLCMGNTGNVYLNIGNVFKNHITVIEKKYIAIHIDIELLSSPNVAYF